LAVREILTVGYDSILAFTHWGRPATECDHDPADVKWFKQTNLAALLRTRTNTSTPLTLKGFYQKVTNSFITYNTLKKATVVTMPTFNASTTILTIAIVLILARPAHAFGAGNIGSVSKVEGVNCKLAYSSAHNLQRLIYR
jgi:hypothetical protein